MCKDLCEVGGGVGMKIAEFVLFAYARQKIFGLTVMELATTT